MKRHVTSLFFKHETLKAGIKLNTILFPVVVSQRLYYPLPVHFCLSPLIFPISPRSGVPSTFEIAILNERKNFMNICFVLFLIPLNLCQSPATNPVENATLSWVTSSGHFQSSSFMMFPQVIS